MKLKIKSLFAYIYFFLITLMYGFSFTPLNLTDVFHDMLLCISILVFILSLIIDNNKRFKISYTEILLFCIGILVFVFSHETIFVIMIISAIMIKNIHYQNVLKLIFYERLFMLVVLFLCVYLGKVGVMPVNVPKGIYGQRMAYGLGYTHPNNLGQEIFYLSTLYLCMRNKNIKTMDYFVIILIDFIIYFITGSKTSCILLLLSIFILISINKLNRKSVYKVFSKICLIITIIIPLFGILSPYLILTGTGIIKKIIYFFNGLLNQRISNASMLYLSFPLTLFGKIIDLNFLKQQFGYNVVDSSYIFSLFNFGIIGFTTIFFLYFESVKELLKKKEYVYVTVIIMTLIFAFMENILRAMYMNFCMLFWWEAISSINTKIKKSRVERNNIKNDSKKDTLHMVRKKCER